MLSQRNAVFVNFGMDWLCTIFQNYCRINQQKQAVHIFKNYNMRTTYLKFVAKQLFEMCPLQSRSNKRLILRLSFSQLFY